MTEIINGWEYLTEVNPNTKQKQNLQSDYLKEYNLAYHNFINGILIQNVENIKTSSSISTRYKYIIDCEGDADIINNDNNYPLKFMKSKFLKNKIKRVKNDLITYYKPHGFYVKGPYEIFKDKGVSTNRFCIELCW